jgi:hypothetical protein
MSTLKYNTWLNTDNTENYKCRAWVNFNGTGTVAIRASGNVSSITDGGAGTYTVNFTNAMPDANYCSQYMGSDIDWGSNGTISSYSSSSMSFVTHANAGTLRADVSTACIAIFR